MVTEKLPLALLVLGFFALAFIAPPAWSHDAATVPDIIERVHASVVSISATKPAKKSKIKPGAPATSPTQNKAGGKAKTNTSQGSGFIIDAGGYIVTTLHTIAGATTITVTLTDGQKITASVVGQDVKTDIALIKITAAAPLTPVKFGDSATARLGEPVIIIGNPFGFAASVSTGIVSGLNRNINAGPYDQFIQTDAAINRGNTGGPMFNLSGDVIGMITSIVSPSGGSSGLGFALPSILLRQITDKLRQHGSVRRGWLGVRIQTVTKDIANNLKLDNTRGTLVAEVVAGGPAEKAGFKTGDVIIRFDGKDVREMRDLPRIVAGTVPGKKTSVDIIRKGKPRVIEVVLGLLPGSAAPPARSGSAGKPPANNPSSLNVFGMTLRELTGDLRSRYKIAPAVSGIVITGVQPGSIAAGKNIKPGEVVSELANIAVGALAAFASDLKKLASVKDRKSILLLISSATGTPRFVALNTAGLSIEPGRTPPAPGPGAGSSDLDKIENLDSLD